MYDNVDDDDDGDDDDDDGDDDNDGDDDDCDDDDDDNDGDDDDYDYDDGDDDDATPQNLGPHFVRACTSEMHVNILQETLYIEIYRKMPRPRT